MRSIKINENAIIVIKSVVLTIIAIFLLMAMLSSMRSIGVNILNDSLLGNVLLEVTILIVQLFIVWRYRKYEVLSSIGFSKGSNSIKYIFKGIGVGIIGTILMYSVIFLGEIGFYEEIGFKSYGIKIVTIFIISTFVRAFFPRLFVILKNFSLKFS